jgi:hypothetical protein
MNRKAEPFLGSRKSFLAHSRRSPTEDGPATQCNGPIKVCITFANDCQGLLLLWPCHEILEERIPTRLGAVGRWRLGGFHSNRLVLLSMVVTVSQESHFGTINFYNIVKTGKAKYSSMPKLADLDANENALESGRLFTAAKGRQRR